MNIYVGNLSWGLKDQDLANLFAPFGEVASAKIVMDKFTQRSKGFGFVEMPNDEQAQAAISQLNGSEVEGRNLVVNESRPKEEGGGGGCDAHYAIWLQMVDRLQKNRPNHPILTGPVLTLAAARRSRITATITRAKIIQYSLVGVVPVSRCVA